VADRAGTGVGADLDRVDADLLVDADPAVEDGTHIAGIYPSLYL
jgi:hypothetical protein